MTCYESTTGNFGHELFFSTCIEYLESKASTDPLPLPARMLILPGLLTEFLFGPRGYQPLQSKDKTLLQEENRTTWPNLCLSRSSSLAAPWVLMFRLALAIQGEFDVVYIPP